MTDDGDDPSKRTSRSALFAPTVLVAVVGVIGASVTALVTWAREPRAQPPSCAAAYLYIGDATPNPGLTPDQRQRIGQAMAATVERCQREAKGA